MKSKLLIISICAIFILNSCASTKYSSAYDDSIYYYPSEISKTERKADQQTIDKLTAETKNNRNKYKNSDTVFISNRTVAELDLTPEKQYVIQLDDIYSPQGNYADSTYNFTVNFNIDNSPYNYNYPWSMGYYGSWYPYHYRHNWHYGCYDPWYGPYYGWGGFYDPWYSPWYGPSFAWGGCYDPWYGPNYGWGGWYDPWYGPGYPAVIVTDRSDIYYGHRDSSPTGQRYSNGREDGRNMIANGSVSRRPTINQIRGNSGASSTNSSGATYTRRAPSSTNSQFQRPSNNTNGQGNTMYRRGTTTNYRQEANNPNNKNNATSYRRTTNSSRNNETYTPATSSYNRSSSSYSGGSSRSGSYSGGGRSSGGTSGGSQRR